MTDSLMDPATATRWVVWGGLLLGLMLGAAGQATRFCVRGAIADLVIARSPGRLAGWLLAVMVAMLAVQALVALGLFDASRTLAWSPRLPWLSYVAGGAIFGFGMMLGGGCPQRNLVKSGSGDLRALVTLVVTAIAALMTLRGMFAPWRVEGLDRVTIELGKPQDLGSLLTAFAPGTVRAIVVALAMAATLTWVWRHRRGVRAADAWGGVLVGLCVPAAFLLTGWLGYLAEHPETLEQAWLGTQSRRPEGLSFVAPLAHALDLLTLWTDRNTVATFGVMLSLGVLLGSFAWARARGGWRLQAFTTPRELLLHLSGGVLMGFGGVTALGCTLGNGVTGLAMLSAGAVLATAGIVAGALVALRLRLNHDATGLGSAPNKLMMN
ncbi:MAG: YeeE/YedE family protein [Pseudomonadota bacterium]